jgi:hypothetical protein
MIARQISSTRWRRGLLRATIALCIAIAFILLVTGCISQPIYKNQTGNATVTRTPLPVTTTITIPVTINKEFKESLQTLMEYKENMTHAQQKIPTLLLEIIDINFPSTEKERQNLKTIMITKNQLVPADQAKVKFNIRQSAGLPVGDQVYIYIYVDNSSSTHVIDSHVTQVTGRDEKYHFAVAWIDVKNVEKLATLSEVKSIMVVQPAYTDIIS